MVCMILMIYLFRLKIDFNNAYKYMLQMSMCILLKYPDDIVKLIIKFLNGNEINRLHLLLFKNKLWIDFVNKLTDIYSLKQYIVPLMIPDFDSYNSRTYLVAYNNELYLIHRDIHITGTSMTLYQISNSNNKTKPIKYDDNNVDLFVNYENLKVIKYQNNTVTVVRLIDGQTNEYNNISEKFQKCCIGYYVTDVEYLLSEYDDHNHLYVFDDKTHIECNPNLSYHFLCYVNQKIIGYKIDDNVLTIYEIDSNKIIYTEKYTQTELITDISFKFITNSFVIFYVIRINNTSQLSHTVFTVQIKKQQYISNVIFSSNKQNVSILTLNSTYLGIMFRNDLKQGKDLIKLYNITTNEYVCDYYYQSSNDIQNALIYNNCLYYKHKEYIGFYKLLSKKN